MKVEGEVLGERVKDGEGDEVGECLREGWVVGPHYN